MPYPRPQFSRREYDSAGDALIHLAKDDPARIEAIDRIGNWRACHALPTDIAHAFVSSDAYAAQPDAITAQRLKRLESIEIKLRQTKMRLTQMQDIGGCRAVVDNAGRVRELADSIASSLSSAISNRFSIIRDTDYLAAPKQDGYRSIHLIAEYDGDDVPEFKKLKVEIQVRSHLQHLWSTAVEICQFFTQQRFKTVKKTADEKWLRYFALASTYFAMIEKMPLVPRTPGSFVDVCAEMRSIDDETGIIVALSNWNRIISPSNVIGGYFFVMHLNSKLRWMVTHSYQQDQLAKAEEKYLELEKATEGDPTQQVVLVSTKTLESLRTAYPNYFINAARFIELVSRLNDPAGFRDVFA